MALIMNNMGGAPSVQGFVPVYTGVGYYESGSPGNHEDWNVNVVDGALVIAHAQYGASTSVTALEGSATFTDVTSEYSGITGNAKVWKASGTATKIRTTHAGNYGGYACFVLSPVN